MGVICIKGVYTLFHFDGLVFEIEFVNSKDTDSVEKRYPAGRFRENILCSTIFFLVVFFPILVFCCMVGMYMLTGDRQRKS